jgi:hypothetical protein
VSDGLWLPASAFALVWTGGEWDGVVDNAFGVAYYLLLDGGVVGNACSVTYYLLLDGVNTVAICV